MKTMSMTALILMLGASPAGAGIFTVQDQEGVAQCAASEAMLIGNVTEGTVLFPNELGACHELDAESSDQNAAGLIQRDKIAHPINAEPAVEVASRVGSGND